MDEKQIARANDLISGMREQRDAAHNRVVELAADLLAARRENDELKKRIETIEDAASSDIEHSTPSTSTEHALNGLTN